MNGGYVTSGSGIVGLRGGRVGGAVGRTMSTSSGTSCSCSPKASITTCNRLSMLDMRSKTVVSCCS